MVLIDNKSVRTKTSGTGKVWNPIKPPRQQYALRSDLKQGLIQVLQTEPLSTDEALQDSASQIVIFADDNIVSISNQQIDGWISHIQQKLYREPSVESVYYSIERGNIDFWIVIPKHDIELVRRLAQCQAQITNLLVTKDATTAFFDFHIIYRNGHTEDELIPKGAILLPK